MRQARAVPLPNEALYIEEIRFWLNIMQEHTKFIKAGLPVEAAEFLADVKEFYRAFSSLSQQAEKIKSVKQSRDFIGEIVEVMTEFECFQRKVLAEIFQGKLRGTNFPFFLDHMLREANYFSAFLRRMLDEKVSVKTVSHTRELVIWLRFMTDHTKLIRHDIDPSECRMIKMAEEFIVLFEHLVLESRDLASMLYRHQGEVRVFRRFLLDIRMDVQRLRDFNKMAEDLIKDCRLLGIMDAELAAHLRREAEHCLLKIALLEKEFLKHCPDDFQDDVDDAVWESVERSDDEDDDETIVDEEMNQDASLDEQEDCLPIRNGELEESGEAAEPVIAIMEAAASVENVPLCENEHLRGEEVYAPADEDIKEVEHEEIEIVPDIPEGKNEPVYIKPIERRVMPRNFAPSAPRERYDKSKQLLPRPLGKTKK